MAIVPIKESDEKKNEFITKTDITENNNNRHAI